MTSFRMGGIIVSVLGLACPLNVYSPKAMGRFSDLVWHNLSITEWKR